MSGYTGPERRTAHLRRRRATDTAATTIRGICADLNDLRGTADQETDSQLCLAILALRNLADAIDPERTP